MNADFVIKEEPLDHQGEDQSDAASGSVSLIADNDAINTGDAFSWAFVPECNTQASASMWRSSGDLQWQEGRTYASVKPFEGITGVSLPNVAPNATPLDFFHMFVPRSIFSIALKETNNFVEFYQDEKRDQGREWWDWTDSNWTPMEDEEEMQKFLGICMVMGVKRLPHPQYYWSNQEDMREDLIANAMPAVRFSKLMQYFYLSNPWRDPERIANDERRAEACFKDPLYKLSNSLWLSVQEASWTMYNPNKRVILRQQEASDKSQRREQVQSSDLVWKVLTVEDATTGYITNAQFHRVLHGLDASDAMFPSESDVTGVLSDLEERSHVVYADSVFISPQTACKLFGLGFHVCADCSAWPSEFLDTNMTSVPSDGRVHRFYDEVTASAWKCDSTIHRRLTTFMDGESNELLAEDLLDGQESKGSPAFSHVVRHNSVMKCRDDGGYLLSNSTLLAQMSKADWKRLFWIIIDIALNNASILWKESGRFPFSLSEFTMEVARDLISGECATKQKPRARASRKAEIRVPVMPRPLMVHANPLENMDAVLPLPEELKNGLLFHPSTFVPMDNAEHSLVKFPGRGRNCRQCMAEQLRTRSGRRRDTQFGCDVCGINLCRATCFIKFHNQYDLKINRLSITQIATLDFQPPVKRTRPSMDLGASTSTSPQTSMDLGALTSTSPQEDAGNDEGSQ